ncbi:MAG: triose-phosphate isomerase [Bacteriovoracaceae bacterium]|nr:triose-phosphate isomerase [Bacteriovoracaceae bacterium]
MSKKFFIGANWKLNLTKEDIAPFFSQLGPCASNNSTLIIFPQMPLLSEVGRFHETHHIEMGSQNSSATAQGAFTGESSPKTLKSIGASWTLVGHSERRSIFGDTDESCKKKFELALDGVLNPILCVGEEKKIREQGFEAVKKFLEGQLNPLAEILNTHPFFQGKVNAPLVVAYEPVWAIGTGLTPTLPEIEETLSWIRSFISSKMTTPETVELFLMYGGSVNRENSKDFLSLPSCHGLLIGGASLKALDLREIFHTSTLLSGH